MADMTDDATDVENTVRVLLKAAGLNSVSEEEFQVFCRMYPSARKGADSLYIEETRYEEPSLIFSVPYEATS